MTRVPIAAVLGAGALSLCSLAAQGDAAPARTTLSPPLADPAGSWLLPLHAEPGVVAPSRRWASGDTYKASFDDGMTFYPVLGESAPDNLPWRWRTLAIGRTDAAPLVDAEDTASRATTRDGFRYELGYDDGTREIYDIRADGVEQLFELESVPTGGSGDLVVRGRIDSSLECAPRGPAHEPLLFRDASGTAVVRYGAATAIDANGDTLALDTSYADGVIEIRVPSPWLENVAYPLTIDPLTARVATTSSSASAAYCPQIAYDDATDRFVIHDVRSVSASDRDLRLRRVSASFGLGVTLFANLTTTDTRYGSVAVARRSDRWLLAYQATTAFDSAVHVYFHDTNSTLLNSGATRVAPRQPGSHDFAPSLGGCVSSRRAYLAVRRDFAATPTNTDRSIPVGFFVDPNAATIDPGTNLHTGPGTDFDAERVQVSQLAASTSGWLVLWQEFDFTQPNDDWDIVGQRINSFGTPLGQASFGQFGANDQHKIGPAVAGMLTRYGIFYMTTPNLGGNRYVGRRAQRLWFQQISWSGGSSSPSSVAPPILIDEGLGNFSLEFGETSRRAAFDHETWGNWGTVWRDFDAGDLRIARIAADGHVVEDVVLEANPMQILAGYREPSLTFDDESYGFAAVYTSSNVATSDPIYARRLAFGSDAGTTNYGATCFGQVGFDNRDGRPPYAGSPYAWVFIDGAIPLTPTWLVVGTAPTDVPLPASIGGCRLLVSTTPELVVATAQISNSGGYAGIGLALPGATAGLDLYWQGIQLSQGHLWSTDALELRIR